MADLGEIGGKWARFLIAIHKNDKELGNKILHGSLYDIYCRNLIWWVLYARSLVDMELARCNIYRWISCDVK